MAVLIGYASEHGSTQGIAERLGARLRTEGFEVVVRPAAAIDTVDPYEACVLGSAVHDGAWLPGAVAVVRRNATALARRPLWLFSVGLIGDDGSAFGPLVTGILQPMRRQKLPKGIAELSDALGARDHRSFVGAVAPEHWPRRGDFVFRLMGGHYGDHRDWGVVDAWAGTIAIGLRAAHAGVT